MYDKVENTADVLHKVCDIVSYSSVVTNLESLNDEIYDHTCEDPYTNEWLDVANVLNTSLRNGPQTGKQCITGIINERKCSRIVNFFPIHVKTFANGDSPLRIYGTITYIITCHAHFSNKVWHCRSPMKQYAPMQ